MPRTTNGAAVSRPAGEGVALNTSRSLLPVVCSRASGPLTGRSSLFALAGRSLCSRPHGSRRLRRLVICSQAKPARMVRGTSGPTLIAGPKVPLAAKTRSVRTASGTGSPVLTERRLRRRSNHGGAATRPAPSSPALGGCLAGNRVSRHWPLVRRAPVMRRTDAGSEGAHGEQPAAHLAVGEDADSVDRRAEQDERRDGERRDPHEPEVNRCEQCCEDEQRPN